jgi:tRNA pseudouridine13 synthase
VDAARRALRLVPGDLAWQGSAAALQLEFTLPPGAYATSVVRELIETEHEP